MTTEEYLRRVEFALRDLPWGQRRALVSELHAHLAELQPETSLDELGTPEDYAAELRAAAGIARRRGAIAFLRARRPRNVILTAAALTLIGLAVGFVVWVQSYQPLTPIHWIMPSDGRQLPGINGSAVTVRRDRPFRLGVVVENTGPFAVRVLGTPEEAGLFFPTRFMMSEPLRNFGTHGNYVKGPYTPFHSFELEPGQARDLFLEATRPTCPAWAAGSNAGLAGFQVHFRFLWRSPVVSLRLPPLTVVCPNAKR